MSDQCTGCVPGMLKAGRTRNRWQRGDVSISLPVCTPGCPPSGSTLLRCLHKRPVSRLSRVSFQCSAPVAQHGGVQSKQGCENQGITPPLQVKSLTPDRVRWVLDTTSAAAASKNHSSLPSASMVSGSAPCDPKPASSRPLINPMAAHIEPRTHSSWRTHSRSPSWQSLRQLLWRQTQHLCRDQA